MGAVINFVFIVTIQYYFYRGFDSTQEYADLACLSLAVFICALNHIYYYNYIESRRYDKIFYQNLTGLIFGVCAGVHASINEFNYGVAIVPIFVTVGQYLYALKDALQIECQRSCTHRAILMIKDPLLLIICIILLGFFAVHCHQLKNFPIWMIFFSAGVLWISVAIIRYNQEENIIKIFKVELMSPRGNK
jgi:hypothetical protein